MVQAGEQVFGKYEVLRRLAVGGMGEIFLARQTGVVDRLVILKSLLPQLAEDDQALAQFLDEARILGSINHPNVCALYDVGEWDSVYFIAMEYINGVDVAQLLKFCEENKKRLPPLTAAQITREAALGLDAAHVATDAAGNPLRVVHRDISPHNVMVRQDGLSKVVDFGVAVAENRMQKTQAGLLKGKLGYMAPEQIKGAPVEPKADQFSLGVMLWELLTQRRLFVGENAAAVFMKILKDPVPVPSSLVSDIPKELDDIVLRMTAMEPVNRFNRLGDAAVAIKRVLDHYKTPDNASQQLIRATVGPELQARLKELAAAPRVEAPRPSSSHSMRSPSSASHSMSSPSTNPGTPGGGTSSPAFCGTCGTPTQAGDAFCRACGTPMGGAQVARVDVMATGARTGVVRRPDDGSSPGSNPFLSVPSAPMAGTPSPTRLPSSVLQPVRDLDLGLEPESSSRLRIPPPPSQPPATASTRPPSSTRIDKELAVLVGKVEILRQGKVRNPDEAARQAAYAVLQDVSERHALASTTDVAAGTFTFTFSGPTAALSAVTLAQSNIRLAARAGHDVMLRMAVVSPSSSADDEARLRLQAETLVANCAPGASIIADASRAAANDPAITRSASVAMRQGGSVVAHELKLQRRLVGRARDLSAFDALLAGVEKDKKAAQLVIVGDGGVGKTAVLQMTESFARDRGFLCGWARGARVAEPLAFDVLRQLIRGVCTDLLAREGKSGPWTDAIALCELSSVYAARVKAIVDDDQDRGLADVPPQRRRAVLKSSLLYFFEKASARAPIALFVDDMHLGDTPSFELLAELGARQGDKPIAVIVAGRPVQGERVLPLAKRTTLGPLEPIDVVAAASLLLGAPVVDPLAGVVASRSMGNPLVLSVLVRHLVAQGLVAPAPMGVQLRADADRLGLPPNPTSLIHANHARLPADAQSLLLAAAHIGQVFDARQIKLITDGILDIDAVLLAIADAGIITQVTGPEARQGADPQWAFCSTVEQETVLARLDAQQGRMLQRRVANALQKAIDENRFTVERGERLAHHLALAELRAQSAEVSALVASRAADLGLFELAAEHHKRALAWEWRALGGSVADDDKAARVLLAAAAATAAQLEVDPAAAVELSVPVLRSMPPLVAVQARVETLRQRALAMARAKRFSEAEGCLDEALETLQGHYDPVISANLLIDLANVLEQRGDIDSALSQLQEGLKLLGQSPGTHERLYDGLLLLGRLGLRQRQFKAAETAFLRAIDEAHQQGRLACEADARALLGAVAQGQGNLDGALAETEQAIALAERLGDPVLEARLRQQRGRALVAMGRRADAADALSRALILARRGQWDEGVGAMQQLLAVVGG